MNTVPDVLGMQLEKAEKILKNAEIPYEIRRTAPPPGRKKQQTDQIRVIRQSSSENSEILLVCEV